MHLNSLKLCSNTRCNTCLPSSWCQSIWCRETVKNAVEYRGEAFCLELVLAVGPVIDGTVVILSVKTERELTQWGSHCKLKLVNESNKNSDLPPGISASFLIEQGFSQLECDRCKYVQTMCNFWSRKTWKVPLQLNLNKKPQTAMDKNFWKIIFNNACMLHANIRLGNFPFCFQNNLSCKYFPLD